MSSGLELFFNIFFITQFPIHHLGLHHLSFALPEIISNTFK